MDAWSAGARSELEMKDKSVFPLLLLLPGSPDTSLLSMFAHRFNSIIYSRRLAGPALDSYTMSGTEATVANGQLQMTQGKT